MGPASLDAGGRWACGGRARDAPPASMGPASLDAGGRARQGAGEDQDRRASMGPASLDAGGEDIFAADLLALLELQWGRHLSMPEGRLRGGPRAPSPRRFNGAGISRCRRVTEFSPGFT